ncbi:hypothetical protein THAOC_07847, partial [Thalassiosira oceanica]
MNIAYEPVMSCSVGGAVTGPCSEHGRGDQFWTSTLPGEVSARDPKQRPPVETAGVANDETTAYGRGASGHFGGLSGGIRDPPGSLARRTIGKRRPGGQ